MPAPSVPAHDYPSEPAETVDDTAGLSDPPIATAPAAPRHKAATTVVATTIVRRESETPVVSGADPETGEVYSGAGVDVVLIGTS